jgi:hypothetical protein
MNFCFLRIHVHRASEVFVITVVIAEKLHGLVRNVKGNLYYLINVNDYIRVVVLFYNALSISSM